MISAALELTLAAHHDVVMLIGPDPTDGLLWLFIAFAVAGFGCACMALREVWRRT